MQLGKTVNSKSNSFNATRKGNRNKRWIRTQAEKETTKATNGCPKSSTHRSGAIADNRGLVVFPLLSPSAMRKRKEVW